MLRLPTFEQLKRIAELTCIVGQSSVRREKFTFNKEQQILAEKILALQTVLVLVLKSRQIGASTFFCLLDVVVAILNPGIKLAIIVDRQAKATELLATCKSFANQLGVASAIANTRKIVLNNGSQIHALTAAGQADNEESATGRSQTYQVLHITELPYWPNQSAYYSLKATAKAIWIETTAKGKNDLFHQLWQAAVQQQNEFTPIFFSCEDHSNYVADPSTLSDDDWTLAQTLGFTKKESAAWWFRELRNKNNNLVRHLHDYPIKPDDAFITDDGRWIQADPKQLDYTLINGFKIFAQPKSHHRYIAGVDTSGGLNRDASAIAVVCRSTKQLVATYKNNEHTIPQLIKQMQLIRNIYPIDYFVIENDGIGRATIQLAAQANIPYVEHDTTATNKYLGLTAVRSAIEKGIIAGADDLADECNSLHINKHGKFKGSKDLIMAIGFALLNIDRNPYSISLPINKQEIYDPSILINNNSNWY